MSSVSPVPSNFETHGTFLSHSKKASSSSCEKKRVASAVSSTVAAVVIGCCLPIYLGAGAYSWVSLQASQKYRTKVALMSITAARNPSRWVQSAIPCLPTVARVLLMVVMRRGSRPTLNARGVG
jgi:hypothetical protein